MKLSVFILFIILPALEIGMLLLAGKTIGVLSTVLLIILTGIIGAYLMKRQGLKVLYRIQEQFSLGQPPGSALLDGICVLFGGILLLIPGFITDVLGLLLLIPITRKAFHPILLKWLKNWFDRGTFIFYR